MLILFSAVALEPNGLIVLPFVALLLAIALMPFLFKRQWEKHYPKVVIGRLKRRFSAKNARFYR